MKKIYTSLLFALAIGGTAQAQTNMNFEPGGAGATYQWNVFENDTNPPLEFVSNPSPTGINPSATVAKFTALVSGQRWAGTETNHSNTTGMPDFVLDMAHSTIRVMVYKTVISPVAMKLVTPTGGSLGEKRVSNTLVNQWEELVFNFSDFVGGALPDNGVYDQIVIFPDYGDAARTATNIVYFDNITFGGSTTTPTAPMTPAPDPTVPAADVISLYSGVYTNVPVSSWRTEWSNTTLADIQIQGNDTKKYTDLNLLGIEVNPQIDATNMTHLNLNVWSHDFTEFKIKLVDFGTDGIYQGPGLGDDKEHEITFTAPAQNTWITYHIPLSDFTNLTTRAHLTQFIFVAGGKTVYMDNLYLSNENVVVEPTDPMVAAPDPTMPEAQVISLFSNVYTNIAMTSWRTEWSNATLTDIQIQGNDTKKYAALTFVGAESAAQVNATGMTHFNVDVWSADFTEFKIKLVDLGPDGTYQGPGLGDDKEHEIAFATPATSEWITYHIPLSDFTNLTTRGNLAQYIFASNGTSTVYMDNVYFSNDNVAGVKDFGNKTIVMYPNPVKDVLTIDGATVIDHVSIHNVLGQQVVSTSPNAASVQLNVAQLQNGVYIVNTVAGGKTTSQKFVKQ